MISFSNRIGALKPSAIREIFKVLEDPSIISFAGGNPAPETFPAQDLAEISAQIFEKQASKALQYGLTEGYAPLRAQVAQRMKEKFSIGTEKDETIIVSGGQQGVELSCKVLCNESDTVLCEEPSFIGALNAFRSYHTQLVGIPMQEDGMDLEKLEQALKTHKNVKLLYIISTFQNPMGVTTSLQKRKQIYELAKKYHVIIFEDNPYGELRFAGQDIPTIKSMDKDGIVIYCGSFSKILSPGMRIGFVCAPKEIVTKLVVAKQISDVHTNLFFQMVVSEYLKQKDIDSHIAEIRTLYRQKNEAMLQKMDQVLPSSVTYTRPQGGLFIWCDLGAGIDAAAFTKKLLQQKVAVVPGSTFLTDETKPCSCIRLNYSMPSFEQIDQGIEILGKTINQQ